MLPHIQDALRKRLMVWFGEDCEEVLSWLIASEDRRAVIVVGAGFSKNADWKPPRSGSASDEIPLWSKIDKTLSEDLRLPASQTYDGLMLPDLYTADLGAPRYRDVLLKSLPDDDIEPGSVHHALFSLHRPEAVVTTNQLDTLLDRGVTDSEPESRWFSVRHDTDLAQPGAEKRVQLIYLHGHRSNPDSWVFSRSHFEDLDRTRPVMMRRVRQLFAQHPVLFVGFSLTDPNFHALVRQVDREMRHKQPNMLAIMASSQPLPFVKHWQRYGVRIAGIRDGRISEGFKGLFELMGSVGRDRRPAEGFLEFSEAKSALLAMPTLHARIEHLRVILQSRSMPGGGLKAADPADERSLLLELWHEIALPPPAEDEDRSRVLAGRRYVRRSEVSEAEWKGFDESLRQKILQEEAYPFLGELPHDRFASGDLTARIVSYQVRQGTGVTDVAEWLRVWFDEVLDKGNEPDPSLHKDIGGFCSLLSWVITASTSVGGDKAAALDVLQRCVDILHRYQDPRIEHVTSDLVIVAPNESPAVPAVVQKLRGASELAFNACLEEAVAAYAEVVSNTRQDGSPWYEWLAIQGAIGAYDTMIGPSRLESAAPEEDAEQKARRADWAQRLDELSRVPVIEMWAERTEKRKQRLMSSAVDAHRRTERRRLRMDQTSVWSDVANNAWMSWSDLEENGAAPWQVAPLLTWLIGAGLFVSDETEEIRLRLRYCVKDTHKWLSDLAYRPLPVELDSRRNRDQAIVNMVLKCGSGTVTENVAALQSLSGIRLLAQSEQVDLVPEFLETSRRQLGSESRSYWGHHDLSRGYASGWVTYAHLVTSAQGLERLDGYVNALDNSTECDEVVGASTRFPWSRWADEVGKVDMLQRAFLWEDKASQVSRHACPPTIPCVAAERLYGSKSDESIPDGIRDRVLTSARSAAVFNGRLGSYSRELAIYTAARFGKEKTEFDEIVELSYPGLQQNTGGHLDTFARIEALAVILAGCLERTDSEDSASDVFERLIALLETEKSAILKRTELNPHHGIATTILRAIADFGRRYEKPLPPDLTATCLQLIRAEPEAVSSLAPILREEDWKDRWSELGGIILAFSRPSTDPESQSHQSAIVGMLRETLDYDEIAKAAWLVPAWAVALGNCTSERTLLANHQAALTGSLVCSGVFSIDDALWRMAADGVRAAAKDPRPVIRVGVANVHRHLQRQDPKVEALRADLTGLGAAETYAAVNAAARTW